MREILFRGKRENNGKWVEGSLSIQNGETLNDGTRTFEYRIMGMRGELDYVNPETVCQYTGLKDKNGKKIFEWDIVKVKFRDGRVGSLEKEYNYVVRYDGSQASFEFEGHDELLGCPCLVQQNQHTFEVIGNVFDHKEFLNED